MPELIRRKRDGGRLADDEIREFVRGIADGDVPDYQAAAMLMAIFFRGLDRAELAAWADAMLRSGDLLDLSAVDRPIVDKHSTGGVGDKISLPLASAVAACGGAVPMVSGRGLAHTGGTLDKLEAIPGLRTDLEPDALARQVAEIGVVIAGQSERLVPADRVLYALRDVTATIESVPLIASSIMAKKLAEGLDALVLDCKVGRGAFMKTRDDAARLASAMRSIGAAEGTRVTVALTAMDEPIGERVGNALEVVEAIEVLHGGGPADTRELTVGLGAEMLLAASLAKTDREAAERLAAALDDGSALAVFRRLIEAQGGDPRVVDDPGDVLPKAAERTPVPAKNAGTVTVVDSEQVGLAALELGAGRRRKDDAIDPAVGLELRRRQGDEVAAGEALAVLVHNGRGVEAARERVLRAYEISETDTTPAARSRLMEVMR